MHRRTGDSEVRSSLILSHLGPQPSHAQALVTASVSYLPAAHPIRRLLKPFTYRTISVNRASAALLCQEFSLLHRSTAFDTAGLTAAFEYSINEISAAFDPFREGGFLSSTLLDAGEEQTPFAHDAARFRRVVRDFVSAYVHVYYRSDDDVIACARRRPCCRYVSKETSAVARTVRSRLSHVPKG